MVRTIPNGIAAIFLLQTAAAQDDAYLSYSDLDFTSSTADPDARHYPSDTTSSSSSTVERNTITFTSAPATDLVRNLLRDPDGGAEIRNVVSTGRACFAGYANGHAAAGKIAGTDRYLIPDAGIVLSTGNPYDLAWNDSSETSTNHDNEETGEPDLESELPYGSRVYDACFVQFEFRCPPASNDYVPSVRLDYVFGSEEHESEALRGGASQSVSNDDAFGAFLNGENIALVPDGPLPITVNNVNGRTNSEYFIENGLTGRVNRESPYSGIEADGITTRLRASGDPKPGWNEMKLVIGDVNDGNLDSWALLAGGSLSCVEEEAKEGAAAGLTTTATMTSTTIRLPGGKNITTENSFLSDISNGELPQVRERPFRMTAGLAVGILVMVGLIALLLPAIAIAFQFKRF